ncbi:MAG: ATP-binding protein, partial [Candidatus Rokuibacteriota bacterium]
EYTRSPRTQGWLTVEASAVSYGRTTPYLPVLDLLKGYFHIEDRDLPPAIRDRVTGGLAGLDERLKDAVAPLVWLLEALPDDDPFRALGPAERRLRAQEAFRGLLLREARRQPVLLVAESLHWIDTESQAFLDAVVESLPGARLLLVASYRPEYQHGWGGKSYYRQLPLAPLGPESARALFRGLVGGAPGLEPLETLLVERTEGNPFFLEESVRRLVETHALAGERGAYRLAKPIGAVLVPATVQAVIAARIDRLPPEEKQLLEVASVVGKAFAFPLLAAVADLPEADLRRALTHLQAAEFLYEASLFPEVEYAFRHALSHDVTYVSLLLERRRLLHARILEAMERLYADRLTDHVDRLAHHARHGEVWARAHIYLRQAGASAASRSANREAATWLEHALAALGRLPDSRGTQERGIDIRLELRPLYLQLGRLSDVLALSRDAERLAQRLEDQPRLARVYTYLINYHYLKGEPERAIDYGRRCLALGADDAKDLALHAMARRYMGHCHHARGEYGLAASVLEQNIEALETAGDLPADTISYVGSRAWLAFTLAETGDFDRAHAHAARAQKVADASRLAYSQAIAWTLAGLVWLRQGHLEAAVQPLERSLEACRDRDLPVWRPIPASLLGLALARLGRTDEALPFLRDGVDGSRQLGINAYLPLWTAQLAEGLLLAGRPAEAEAAAREALDLARAFGERGHEAWIHRVLGQIAARREPADRDEAE